MPEISTLFPSRYFSAGDLQGQPLRVTIESVTTEAVGQGNDAQNKPVLHFVGHAKALVMNKVNAMTIAGLLGSNTDTWAGRDIILKATTTLFQGRMVPCLRIDAFTPPRRGAPPPEPKRPAAAPPQEPPPFDDDDIPM